MSSNNTTPYFDYKQTGAEKHSFALLNMEKIDAELIELGLKSQLEVLHKRMATQRLVGRGSTEAIKFVQGQINRVKHMLSIMNRDLKNTKSTTGQESHKESV